MKNFWIIPGSEQNWRQALISKGIWGLENTSLDKVYWLAIAPNDIILFYVSGKVKGIIGYGIVRGKFIQDIPLWEAEIKEGRVKWPLRFEFDVEFLLPQNEWSDKAIGIAGGGKFRQPLIPKELKEIEPVVRQLNPKVSNDLFKEFTSIPGSLEKEVPSPTHEEVKKLLVDIGKLQGYVADPEFPIRTERLDVVWRRLPESVPTFAFEVQVGGDLYHALGKLKLAHEIWNSRIFLAASQGFLGSTNQLLSGTFREIQNVLKFIEMDKILSLHQSKRGIHQLERDMGLIP